VRVKGVVGECRTLGREKIGTSLAMVGSNVCEIARLHCLRELRRLRVKEAGAWPVTLPLQRIRDENDDSFTKGPLEEQEIT